MLQKMESFEQFMARALHDPQRGYYARRIQEIGNRGDFTTAPMFSDALARALAVWIGRAMSEYDCRDVIEIGPGEGKLAHDLLRHLPCRMRWKIRLHLIESSAPLAARQRKRLGNRVRHHSRIQDALASCGGNAIIFSNELVDAFPVRRFQKTSAGWQEIAISFSDRKIALESLILPVALPDSSGFLDSYPLGQRIEVHESYHRFIADWMPHWKSGRMLTIDYGAEISELYRRRPHGTLRGYLLHHRVEGPEIYNNVGRQDLTADVNFTDLMRWSRPWICEQTLTTFSDFLDQHSPLTDPDGAGNAFLVLDQKRA